MGDHRIGNAGLTYACARCHRRFPRMYTEDGKIVCRVGTCRKTKGGATG